MSSNKSIDPFFYREIRRAQYELESRRLGNISNSLYLPEQRRPFEELPPNIVDFAAYLSDSVGFCYNSILYAVLGCFSAATRGRFFIQLNDVWSEALVDYTVVLSGSGTRKSALMDILRRPFQNFESLIQNNYKENCFQERSKQKLIRKTNQKRLEMDAREIAKKMTFGVSEQEILEKIDSYSQRLASIEQLEDIICLKMPELFVGNATLKSISQQMANNGGCACFMDDEGGFLMGEITHKGKNPTLLLKSYDMTSFSESTTQKTLHLNHPALSMLFIVQRESVYKLYASDTLRELGFTPRITPIFASHLNPKSFDFYNSKHILNWYNEKIFKILNENYTRNPNRKMEKISIEKKAYDKLKDFEYWLKSKFPTDGYLKPFIAKLHGKAARFAGALHVSSHDEPCCVPISLEFMKAGIFLAEESLRHAEYIFSPSGLAAEGDAKKILEWMSRLSCRGCSWITSTEVEQGIRNLNKKRCHQALDLLEKVNIIKQIIYPDRARICVIHRDFWDMNGAINDGVRRLF